MKDQGCNFRSRCPISMALDVFGDRWTLLILRDLLFKQRRTFREFQSAGEGIATNILSERLARLKREGFVTQRADAQDGRMTVYEPTEKALDLLPVLVEIVVWSARHNDTAAPSEIVSQMTGDREAFIRAIRDQFKRST